MEEKKPVGRPRKYPKGYHPNTIKALKKGQFKEGKSGNPGGRSVNKPKPKPTLEEVLNDVGHEMTTVTVGGERRHVTKYYAFSHNLFKNAIQGKSPAVKELLERLYGKSPDFLNLNVTEKPKFKGGSPEKYVNDILRGDKKVEA